MKTSDELINGDWFVASVHLEDWHSRPFERCAHLGGCPVKKFDCVNYVICVCEHEYNAKIIAEMFSRLPHDSTHQISDSSWAWVCGRKVRGGVVLTEIFPRCAQPEGRIADSKL